MSTIFGTPNNKCTTWKRKIKLFCRVSPRLHHPLRPPWEGMPGPPTPSLPSAGRGHRWRSSPPDSVILCGEGMLGVAAGGPLPQAPPSPAPSLGGGMLGPPGRGCWGRRRRSPPDPVILCALPGKPRTKLSISFSSGVVLASPSFSVTRAPSVTGMP